MPKKIYDIIPPNLKNKVKGSAKKLDLLSAKGKKSGAVSRKAPKNKKLKLKWILILSAFVLLVLFVFLHNILAKADITIWPKTDILTLEDKLTASKSVEVIDFSKKAIPANYIDQEQDGWQVFEATGTTSNDVKATGTITVYNKISPATSLSLKEGTRFLSDSGKIFVILEKITVPSLKGNTPGSVKVKVQAQEAGPEYNIGSSKFSIPGLRTCCGSYYYSVFAESTDKIEGGYKGVLKKVTNEDISRAKDSLTKNLLLQAEDSLLNKLTSNEVILDGAISREIIEASSDIKPDTVIDKFTEGAKVKVSALVFSKKDIEEFIKSIIMPKLGDSQDFLKDNLEISYTPELIDMRKGTESFGVKFSAKTYYNVDISSISNYFKGQSANQIKKVISQTYGDKVYNTKVSFWPFWVFRAPMDINKIKISLNFD